MAEGGGGVPRDKGSAAPHTPCATGTCLQGNTSLKSWRATLLSQTERKKKQGLVRQDDPVRPGTIRYDPVRSGTIRYDPVRSGTIRYDPVRPGTIRYDPVRPGTIRYDPVRLRRHIFRGCCSKNLNFVVPFSSSVPARGTSYDMSTSGPAQLTWCVYCVGGGTDFPYAVVEHPVRAPSPTGPTRAMRASGAPAMGGLSSCSPARPRTRGTNTVGGWWRLAVCGWWRLAGGGWWSLGVVLKAGQQQRDQPLSPPSGTTTTGRHRT